MLLKFVVTKFHLSFDEGKNCVIPSDAYVLARMHFGPTLPNDDVSWNDAFAVDDTTCKTSWRTFNSGGDVPSKLLDPEPLRSRVAPVLR